MRNYNKLQRLYNTIPKDQMTVDIPFEEEVAYIDEAIKGLQASIVELEEITTPSTPPQVRQEMQLRATAIAAITRT